MTFQTIDLGDRDIAGRLGEALGGGLGTGLEAGITQRMKSALEAQKQQSRQAYDIPFKQAREQRLLRKDVSDLYNKRIGFINQDLKEAFTKDEINNLKNQKKSLMKELAKNQRLIRMGLQPDFTILEQLGIDQPIPTKKESSQTNLKPKSFFNPNNKSHQETVRKVLEKNKGNREKAQKELDKIFIRK